MTPQTMMRGLQLYRGRSRVGIVLIHEVFELTDYERGVAQMLAEEGYWVVTP